MKKDPTIFLKHILESIEQIEEYTQSLSEKEFLASSQIQDAVLRRLEIIGEAVRNLPEDFRQSCPDIAWHKAMATRNILIRHYFGIDLELVWNTVKESLPEFKKQTQDLLNKTQKK